MYPQCIKKFLAAGVFMMLTLCVGCRDINRLSRLPEEASLEVESESFGSMTSYVLDTRSPYSTAPTVGSRFTTVITEKMPVLCALVS